MLNSPNAPGNETLMDIAIDTGDNVINRQAAGPAEMRTSFIENEDGNEMEAT